MEHIKQQKYSVREQLEKLITIQNQQKPSKINGFQHLIFENDEAKAHLKVDKFIQIWRTTIKKIRFWKWNEIKTRQVCSKHEYFGCQFIKSDPIRKTKMRWLESWDWENA